MLTQILREVVVERRNAGLWTDGCFSARQGTWSSDLVQLELSIPTFFCHLSFMPFLSVGFTGSLLTEQFLRNRLCMPGLVCLTRIVWVLDSWDTLP